MPGAMRKMGVYLGLVEDDEEAAGDAASLYERAHGRGEYHEARYSRGGDAAHVVPRDYHDEEPGYGSEYAEVEYPAYRITTLHPRTYNEARTIGEHFRNGTPVIMNLSEMDDADAKRLVDFAAGLIFGLHGSLERVTAKVFLLSPHNVTVTAADKARIAEGGFFNQS